MYLIEKKNLINFYQQNITFRWRFSFLSFFYYKKKDYPFTATHIGDKKRDKIIKVHLHLQEESCTWWCSCLMMSKTNKLTSFLSVSRLFLLFRHKALSLLIWFHQLNLFLTNWCKFKKLPFLFWWKKKFHIQNTDLLWSIFS